MLNEIKDPNLRKEFEKTAKNPCPYINRIYDFIGIMGRTSHNNGKKLAVQCLYKGTVHNIEKCLKNPENCKKFQLLEKQKEFFKTGR